MDALKGKFWGNPDGIFVNSLEPDDYLPFQGEPRTYDLVTGQFTNANFKAPSPNKLLKVLDACHQWLTREIAKEKVGSKDLVGATIEFEVGALSVMPLPPGSTFRVGKIHRHPEGRAWSALIPVDESKEKELTRLKFSIRICITTSADTFAYEEPDITLEFTGNYKKA